MRLQTIFVSESINVVVSVFYYRLGDYIVTIHCYNEDQEQSVNKRSTPMDWNDGIEDSYLWISKHVRIMEEWKGMAIWKYIGNIG